MAVQVGEVSLLSINDEGGGKAPRLPRWTRQEILVLIQGKRVAEGRVRKVRAVGLSCGGVEPKWATVSSYCKRHGVNRGPVQCRKRWSNLAGDFKKIKEWESQIKEEADSFWVMRSDFRRDRKLPGFFDKEVYDILDRSGSGSPENKPHTEPDDPDHDAEAVFDSGRSATAEDGLFSDFEHPLPPTAIPKTIPIPIPISIPTPTPISEKQYQPFTIAAALLTDSGNNEEPAVNPEIGSASQEGRKRRRFVAEDKVEEAGLIQVLEMNGRILSAQLEAQNMNLKLDREERNNHATSLIAVLNKLADALGRIADKL